MLWYFILSAVVCEITLSVSDNANVDTKMAEDVQINTIVYKDLRVDPNVKDVDIDVPSRFENIDSTKKLHLNGADDDEKRRFEFAKRYEHDDSSVSAAKLNSDSQSFSHYEVTSVTKASTTQAQLWSSSLHVKGSSTEQLLALTGNSADVGTGGFWNSLPSASQFSDDTVSTHVPGIENFADHVLHPHTSPEKVREAKARLLDQLGSGIYKIIPGSSTNDKISKVMILGDVVLVSVIKVDDAMQTVTSSLILDLSWQDVGLSWNQSLYEGVSTLVVPKDQIWTPELFVPNAMDKKDVMSDVKQVFVASDGLVSAPSYFVAETVCPMDLSGFPYDQQDCSVIFLSFNNFDWNLTARQTKSQLGAYLSQSNQWEVLGVSSQVVETHGKNVVYTAYVNLTLRRLSTFYTVCLVLPMVLTSYMNTLVFLLPLQAGEKISFLVTLSVSTSVFTGFFSEVMPRGLTTVPSTLKLLVGVIIQSLLVLLATIVVLRVHHHEQESTKDAHAQSQDVLSSTKGSNMCWEKKFRPVLSTDSSRDIGKASWSGSIEPENKKRLGIKTSPCRLPAVSAVGLDNFFFVLAFLSNTIFLGVLFFQTIYY